MQSLCDREKCYGCGACAFICASDAVMMQPDSEGFIFPVTDSIKCTNCGRCTEICPALHELPRTETSCYAFRCKDPELLYNSSSGGFFSVIADLTVKNGGLVCGAVFDDSFRVRHILSDDIEKMRKSKYVQSDLTGCFESIATALAKDTDILFTGTPCQCHAVKLAFPNSKKLLCAALVCRGAASPLLWDEYLYYLETEKNGALSSFCFRDKRADNDAHTVAFTSGGKEYSGDFMKDLFCRIYSKELSFRTACYSCPYTTPYKPFDFCMGDFWGVEKVFPDLADHKGVSLVISGSKKADELLKSIEKEADIRSITHAEALQPALSSPPKPGLLRRFFFKDLASKGTDGHCDMKMIQKKYGF